MNINKPCANFSVLVVFMHAQICDMWLKALQINPEIIGSYLIFHIEHDGRNIISLLALKGNVQRPIICLKWAVLTLLKVLKSCIVWH